MYLHFNIPIVTFFYLGDSVGRRGFGGRAAAAHPEVHVRGREEDEGVPGVEAARRLGHLCMYVCCMYNNVSSEGGVMYNVITGQTDRQTDKHHHQSQRSELSTKTKPSTPQQTRIIAAQAVRAELMYRHFSASKQHATSGHQLHTRGDDHDGDSNNHNQDHSKSETTTTATTVRKAVKSITRTPILKHPPKFIATYCIYLPHHTSSYPLPQKIRKRARVRKTSCLPPNQPFPRKLLCNLLTDSCWLC